MMEKLVTSEFKLGIITGGQLGKMLTAVANSWDIKTYILDLDEKCPASASCTAVIKGSQLDFDDVYNFGQKVDMITYEVENINIEALKKLRLEGKTINPDPDVLEIIQDKGRQKSFFKKMQVPTSNWSLYSCKSEIIEALDARKLSLPFVQKLREGGYDGKGVLLVKSENDVKKLFDAPSVVEDMVDLEREISVLVARNKDGEIRCFPTVEMEFNEKANLVEELTCPSSLDRSIQDRAEKIATKMISDFGMCGLLAIEMFIDKRSNIWVNEVAPRPHNSGHHTIESSLTSQYEQLLRAVFNFPLGSTKIKMPSVVINILGEQGFEGAVKYEGLTQSLAIDGVKIHLYGKKITKPFRKMGHVTILSPTTDEAKQKARAVREKLKVKSW